MGFAIELLQVMDGKRIIEMNENLQRSVGDFCVFAGKNLIHKVI
jgi:hypothetical protein